MYTGSGTTSLMYQDALGNKMNLLFPIHEEIRITDSFKKGVATALGMENGHIFSKIKS